MRFKREYEFGGKKLTMEVVSSPRAKKRMISYKYASRCLRITLPENETPTPSLLESILLGEKEWILQQISRAPEQIVLEHGATVPVLGIDFVIRQDQSRRFLPHLDIENREIVVGRTEFPGRRIKALLEKELLDFVGPKTKEMAASIDRHVTKVKITDCSTYWGKCFGRGEIRYNWQLVLCPPDVVEYLIAHEVSHLVHMNHSKEFWSLCRSLSPISPRMADLWLDANTHRLGRYITDW